MKARCIILDNRGILIITMGYTTCTSFARITCSCASQEDKICDSAVLQLGFESRGCQVGHFLHGHTRMRASCVMCQDMLQNRNPFHNKYLKNMLHIKTDL